MSFVRTVKDVKTLVEREFRGYFRKKHEEALRLHPASVAIVDQVADLTLRGGKRTRAFLVWLGYETILNIKCQISNINIKNQKERKLETVHIPGSLLNAMLALELFQTFCLIHDDIIDEDRQRRGGPTVHEHFKLKAQSSNVKSEYPEHFGTSMAILSGDLALAWASELISSTKNEHAQALFWQMAEETILGQSLDVLREQASERIDVNKINLLKTAYYSVARPLMLGAIIGGADKKTLSLLEKYGLAVGQAYQLRDDFLDGRLNQEKFKQESEKLISYTREALGELRLREEVKQIYNEFTQFVAARQT